MDTSPEYILQCEKAEEIQKVKPHDSYPHSIFYCPVHGIGCDVSGSIWLPRQGELQRILHEDFIFQLIDLEELVESGLSHSTNSMEQLWLAYVMKEKYGKQWDGENWIKEGKDDRGQR